MAQVRKFNSGGGMLKLNGKDYTAEQINEYLNQSELSSEERAALAGVVNAIASGKIRSLDRNANTLSGDDVSGDFSKFYGNDKRSEKNASGRGSRWANRQSRRNSDFHIANTAISKLGEIEDYFYPKGKKNGTKDKTLKKASSGFFTYDDKGTYVDNASNYEYMGLVDNLFSYLKDVDKTSWNTGALSEAQLGWLHDWYNKNIGYETGLKERISSGRLTDNDRILLDLIGISQGKPAIEAQTQQQLFQDKGYDYSKVGQFFEINDKGQLVAKIGSNGKNAFQDAFGGNGNYWFNDEFANAYSDLAFLKDHFLINGILHKASDAGKVGSDLYNFIRQSDGFYDSNRLGNWSKANDIIRQYWNDKQRSDYALASKADIALKYFRDNPNIRWTSVTGMYDYPIDPNHQLLNIYDPNQEVDMFGQGKTQYIVLDQEGNLVNPVDNPGKQIKTEAEPLKGRTIVNAPGSIYHGMEIFHPEGSGVSFFWDPKTNRLIYNGGLDFVNENIVNGRGFLIPEHIAKVLNSHPDSIQGFINNLLERKDGHAKTHLRDFKRTLGRVINTGWRDKTDFGLTNLMSDDDWIELGYSPEQAQWLWDEFKRISKNDVGGSQDERIRTYLVDAYNPTPVPVVQAQKLGGKIEYIKKLQPGGIVGNTKTQGFTQQKLSQPFVNENNFHEFGSDGVLTTADYVDLSGLVADAVGIGLGVSGLPFASGIAGAVGSTAGFAADIARDGLDWSDVGNYGLNLGLDILSIIPWAGSAAQSGKLANKIRKFAKPIMKLFANPIVVKGLAAMGVGSAVKTSAEKIINGEKWTVRDVRNVMNGLSGALTLKKTGIIGGGATKQDVGEIDVKIKGKAEKIRLEPEDLEALSKVSGKDVDTKLREIILKKRPKIGKVKTKSGDIDFSPSKIQEQLGWRFWKGKQPTGEYDFQIKSETVAPEFTPDGLRTGSQNKERFLHYLRTGEWKTVDASGNIVNGIDDLWNSIKWRNRIKLPGQTHQLYLPKHYWYTQNYIPNQAGYVEQPVPDPYARYFKNGGSIVKGETGITTPKPQNEPTDPATGKLISELTPEELSAYKQTIIPKTKVDRIEYKKALKAARISGKDFVYKGVNFGKIERKSDPLSIKRNTQGNPIGEKDPLDWEKIGAIGARSGRIAGELAMTMHGINNQLDYADKNRRLAKSVHTVNDPEYYNSFNDNGKKLAYDQEAINTESQANRNLSSDSYLNRLFKRQAAAEARTLRLQGKLAQSADYSKFKQDNLARRAYYAEKRTTNLNKDILRHINADASYNIEAGKAEALKNNAWKGAINDAIGMYNQQKLSSISTSAIDAQRKYQDWYNQEKAIYDKDTNIDKTKFATFDSYLRGNKTLLNEQRAWQDQMTRLQQRASLYRKKGGKLRPTSEQIKIDTEKAKHKAIDRLSKQSFELLKKALS